MKNTLILAVILSALPMARAQQIVSREDALKAAFMLSVDLKQMLNTPIPTDPDVKRPAAVREGERGGMVMPETKLSREVLAKVGAEVVPVGQLWLRKVSLLSEGQPMKSEKLQTVTVGNEQATVLLCALGVRKGAEGKLELLVYGKEKQPVLRLPLKEITATQENPIEISAEPQGDGATVTLKILGKYEASFTVGAVEER